MSAPVQPEKKSGGLAIASLILGIVALFFSWIPIVNYFSVMLGVIGMVLGGIGIFKSSRVMSIFGTLLSLAAVIISFAVFGSFADAVDEELNSSASVAVGY